MGWGAAMTLTRVERWDVRRDGPLTEAALQRKIDALGFSVAARVYPAGVAELPPVNDRVCLLGIVRGIVKLVVDDEQTFLSAGDLAFVPRGAVSTVEAVGLGMALCLEAFPCPQSAQGSIVPAAARAAGG